LLKFWQQCLALFFFFLVLPIHVASAAVDYMPVNQIQPGMQGVAKTVIQGTKIEEFGVEVLGIMANKGPSGDLILVRTYGDLIDRTGGIVQGMSGSPVYINGKLVGAIAYGWPLSDHRIGMVTPIQDMLKLWDAPDIKNNRELQRISLSEEFEPVATPLMAAGFTEPALKMLTEKLKPLNMIPYAVGGAPADTNYGPLEPGSSVGVELVRGDISLSALGTVTYVEDGKVLAFGHPFLKKGNTSYFMTNAYVFTAVDGLESGFKVGTTGEAVGVINQDRSAGIAGQLNKYPNIVPIRMKITDEQLGRTQDLAVQVIHDEQLVPALAASSVFNAVDKTMDRVGPGTARVSFEIMAQDMPGEILKRDNMFYTAGSIGELTVAELFDALNLLANNKFNPVEIMDVKVNISVSEDRKTASILEARAATATAKPGDTVNLNVKLKPFRGDPVTKTVPVVIPKDQPAGPVMLEVRGGGLIPVTQLLLKQQGIDLSQGKDRQKSFADILKDFQENDRNNELVVEIMDVKAGAYLENGDDVAAANPKQSTKTKPSAAKANPVPIAGSPAVSDTNSLNKTRLTTDYIIDNDTKVMLNIVKP
jgi:hypothetical protein